MKHQSIHITTVAAAWMMALSLWVIIHTHSNKCPFQLCTSFPTMVEIFWQMRGFLTIHFYYFQCGFDFIALPLICTLHNYTHFKKMPFSSPQTFKHLIKFLELNRNKLFVSFFNPIALNGSKIFLLLFTSANFVAHTHSST